MHEFKRGWRVVLGAALGSGAGLSLQPYVISLFVKPLQETFHWTRGEISGASGAGLLGIFIGPLLGWAMDRLGVRPVLIASSLAAAFGYAALANQPGTLRVYYILSALLVVLGSGTSPMGYTRAVLTWFDRSRGWALGLTLIGVSATGLLAAPLLSAVIGHYGVRAGYYGLALIVICVGFPASLFWVRERGGSRSHGTEGRSALGADLREALISPRLYVLSLALFLASAGLVGVIAQLQPMLTDAGMPRNQAALMLSALALSVIVGRLAVGWALDRLWPPAVAAVALAVPSLGALILAQGSAAPTLVLSSVLLLGFAQGAETDIAAFFIGRYFGLRSYARLYAVVAVAFAAGTVTGAVGSGFLYDHFHTYRVPFSLAAAAFFAAGLTMLLMGKAPPGDTVSAPGEGEPVTA